MAPFGAALIIYMERERGRGEGGREGEVGGREGRENIKHKHRHCKTGMLRESFASWWFVVNWIFQLVGPVPSGRLASCLETQFPCQAAPPLIFVLPKARMQMETQIHTSKC